MIADVVNFLLFIFYVAIILFCKFSRVDATGKGQVGHAPLTHFTQAISSPYFTRGRGLFASMKLFKEGFYNKNIWL